MEHVKRYVPGLSNLNEKLSSVSRAPERNSPVSLTTVCGSSSLLTHETCAPASMVKVVGLNMKSFTSILFGAAAWETAHVTAIAAAISGDLIALNFMSIPCETLRRGPEKPRQSLCRSGTVPPDPSQPTHSQFQPS